MSQTSRIFTALFLALGLLACSTGQAIPRPESEAPAPSQPAAQRIEIAVEAAGFVPASHKVKVGKPVTLVVTRKIERTCATEIVIKAFGIKKDLPLNQAVEVTLTPTKVGSIRFACAMDMIAGELVAQ